MARPKPHAQQSHAERQARGRVRVEVYLDPTEAACLEELRDGRTRRDTIGQAILDAYETSR
jgi:hypothetical protein